MIKLCVIGATLSGNKGAASMLIALVKSAKHISSGECAIHCLSIYPDLDKRFNYYKNLKIVKCTPFDLICIAMPLALFYFLTARFKFVKKIFSSNAVIKTILESDLIINMAGISYADNRGPVLIYNIACDSVPLFLGKKIFKFSQALGPFKNRSNRIAAKLILPRISTIAARGRITAGYLRAEGLNNFNTITDGAFLMKSSQEYLTSDIKEAAGRLKRQGSIIVGVSPSSVVESYCRRRQIQYIDILSRLIDKLQVDKRIIFLVLPFCALEGKRTKKNNDLFTVKKIEDALGERENIVYLNKEYSAEDLRFIISKCDIFITSRYHGLVTALSEGVVPLVIGWSHKYAETLEDFSLSELCMDYEQLGMDVIFDKLSSVIADRQKYRKVILEHFPKVADDAFRNILTIKELLKRC